MKGYRKITKTHFYQGGGFSNPKYVRKSNNKGGWVYYSEIGAS